MIKLKNLLNKKIIKEATTSGQATGARKSKGTTSTDYSKAQSDYDTHMKSEPSKTRSYSRQVSDMTKWIHPWSNKTTTLGTGQKAPKKGWKITTTQQAKKTEPLKKAEPAKKVEPSKVSKASNDKNVQNALKNLQQKVDTSKKVEPLNKKFDTTATAADTAKKATADIAKAQPSVATTSTTYGQGSDTDYATAVKGKSAGQTYSAARATTNPTTTQTGTEDNPDWATWDAKRQSYDTEKQTQKSKDTKSKAAQPLSQIGYGTSGGGMRGKGGGKGKGKGKGKDKKKD